MVELTDSGDEIYLGEILDGRWKVVSLLGGGAFGRVFLGLDLDTGDSVAIKILRMERSQDPAAVLEFADEGRYLERLRSCTRVVDIYDRGTHSAIFTKGQVQLPLDIHYMVLEEAGGALVNLITLDATGFPWNQRLRIFRDVAHGIHQMHLDRVVNRDLKSENVLVFDEAKHAIRGKVTDLGRARILSENARIPKEDYSFGRGDPRFAAPELVWHQGTPTEMSWRAVDLYHLGSVLFELATGVGLTAYAVPSREDIMYSLFSLGENERKEYFEAIKPDLYGRFEVAYEMFSESVPGSIRFPMDALLRQLTDLDPENRFPVSHGRRDRSTSLTWLLRRIDIISLQLYRVDVYARRNQKKKVVAA